MTALETYNILNKKSENKDFNFNYIF